MEQKDVALVLSSGGARGLVHIGAIEELVIGTVPPVDAEVHGWLCATRRFARLTTVWSLVAIVRVVASVGRPEFCST